MNNLLNQQKLFTSFTLPSQRINSDEFGPKKSWGGNTLPSIHWLVIEAQSTTSDPDNDMKQTMHAAAAKTVQSSAGLALNWSLCLDESQARATTP